MDGQDELAHPYQPEDIGLELAAYVVHRDRLDWSALAVARVVDEHADASLLADDLVDRGRHRRLVGHVEGQGATAEVGEVGEGLESTGGGVDRRSGRRVSWSAVAPPIPVEHPVMSTAVEDARPPTLPRQPTSFRLPSRQLPCAESPDPVRQRARVRSGRLLGWPHPARPARSESKKSCMLVDPETGRLRAVSDRALVAHREQSDAAQDARRRLRRGGRARAGAVPPADRDGDGAVRRRR